ncbi:MAG: hypothetical protein D6743_11025 [Calditrichaeota bacterium]|nr:MAG: hypothetical protein D6743_11025 [Calditrichota bacterium]
MMLPLKRFWAMVIVLTAPAWLLTCGKEPTSSIWNPQWQGRPDPVISRVEPAEGAFAGIGLVTLYGENFSSDAAENHVYFDGVSAEILSASTTSVQVKAPNITGDSVRIKLRVDGAILFAEWYPYRLEPAAIEWGDFDQFDDAYAIACDKDENVYVSLKGKKIVRVTPDGERQEYATSLADKASGMKIGPDGSIYYVNILPFMFRIPPQGNDGLFARLPGGAFDLDFGPNGNIYCGGSGKALYRVKTDGSSEVAADYGNVTIRTVRVFNGYVYVGGKDGDTGQHNVWRNQILSATELGPKELYFEWSNKIGAHADLLSLTFAEDGDMYVGTNAPEAIFVVHPDGSFEPLYPGVIEPETYAMTWGNGPYLYVNRRSVDPKKKKIIRINMLKNGAPYFGRK